MNHLIYRPGELIQDSFVVVSNDGTTEVTNLTDVNDDFEKFLFQDGILDTNTLVEVTHRGEGLYQVRWSTQNTGVYDLFIKYTVNGVVRRLHWGAIHVETFGTKNTLHFAFGDHTKLVSNPNLFQIRDFQGALIAEYEVTDTGRSRTI
jgi:hypothetical protein